MNKDETSTELTITQRSKVRRVPKRGHYERELIYQILDEGLVCQVGFSVTSREPNSHDSNNVNQQPHVIPTTYGRVGDKLYIHGSPASRMLRTLQSGIDVCVSVTLLDGLVLARSAFHHSMNYRSVVIFGTATTVQNTEQKLEALQAFSEHIVPGRWDQVRLPTAQEIQATLVLALPLTEASAKVRTGGPIDDEEDYQIPVWAGVIPLQQVAAEPTPDPRLPIEISVPDYALNYRR